MKFETPILNITMYGRENVVTATGDINELKSITQNGDGDLLLDGKHGTALGKVVTVIY